MAALARVGPSCGREADTPPSSPLEVEDPTVWPTAFCFPGLSGLEAEHLDLNQGSHTEFLSGGRQLNVLGLSTGCESMFFKINVHFNTRNYSAGPNVVMRKRKFCY